MLVTRHMASLGSMRFVRFYTGLVNPKETRLYLKLEHYRSEKKLNYLLMELRLKMRMVLKASLAYTFVYICYILMGRQSLAG